ncbi:MAG TPA: hypothetical protein VL371_10275, partial [Gemmataceae bacterium]|nr:hypothetical protein [Gemmataceae bacterium]
GANERATTSAIGLPRAKTLYGPVPEQLRDFDSFASRLKSMLAARRQYRVAEGELLAVPEPKSPGVCALILKLPDHPLAVTVLNFGREDADDVIELPPSPTPGPWTDIFTGRPGNATNEAGRLRVHIPALSGTTFVAVGRR